MSEKTQWRRFAEAKAAMPAPVRDTNAYKYQYADLAQVRSIVVPALNEYGLDIIQTTSDSILTTTIIDMDTGNTLVLDARELLANGTDQARGSSETYQRRYAMLTVCGLAPEDDDGKAATDAAPKSDALSASKQRLWNAVKSYAEKHGGDAKKLAEGAKSRKDYAETAEWYDMVAIEFETA